MASAFVYKLAVWVILFWLLMCSHVCQSTRVRTLEQILAPDTVGVLIEWQLPEGALQLGSAGSGSSGWQLVNPTPLCPLIADALSATAPECVNATISGKASQRPISEAAASQSGGCRPDTCKETRPASACAWEGGSDSRRKGSPVGAFAPPLQSTIVLPAPLDPVLGRAFSHRTAEDRPDPKLKDGKNRLEEKPSHVGLFFDRDSYEPEDSVRGRSEDCEAGTLGHGWVVERVSRELTGLGAHRQLETKVVLTPGGGNVTRGGLIGSVALFEALPSGLYADKFELQRMSADGVVSEASVFGPVDIERPAPECTQSLVVVYPRPVEAPGGKELEASFVLPLHSRYPAVASVETGSTTELYHTTVELGLPFYVLWTESPGLSTEEELRMHSGWRHALWQEASRKGGACPTDWEEGVELKEGKGEDNVVRWAVPHGRAEHAAIVRVGTISASVVATAYLIFLVAMKA